jgi:Heparinase II/III-like protein/Heparinase II/III N-terminus
VSATALAPRPVFCVSAHERRSMEVAEAVAAGRFELAGIERDLGVEPDWLGADLPADEEWRIEWSKFYYGRDLAHAFAQTGERRFIEAWESLVGSWLDQVPIGFDTSDVAARRVQNWLYAWQDLAAAPAFTGLAGGLAERLAAAIGEHAAYVRAELSPERNHRTLELYALFLVPLALPDLDPDGTLLRFAVDELEAALVAEFRSDGVHRESSTHYHLIALRSFVGARENARRFGVAFSERFDPGLGRAYDFALHCTRPDGLIPALSDADTGDYSDLLALAGELLERPAGPPADRNVSFPDGGYFVQRSGWRDDRERFLILDCGPLGDGGHGHYDLLSVEIYGGGRPLVVDPGRFTYSEEPPNLRRWFRGTAAHNTVCVDGLDQTPYTRKRPRGPVAEGRLIGRASAPGLDVIAGEARSPVYEAEHVRVVAFAGERWWVIEDRLRSPRAHRYDLRFHLADEAWGATIVQGRTVRAPGLGMVFALGPEPKLEPGWVSPRYGERHTAPVMSAALDDCADARFVTLVAPLREHEPLPPFDVRRTGERTEVEVDGRVVAWTVGREGLELG